MTSIAWAIFIAAVLWSDVQSEIIFRAVKPEATFNEIYPGAGVTVFFFLVGMIGLIVCSYQELKKKPGSKR